MNEVELIVLEVEITSDDHTLLKYKDCHGIMHMNFENFRLKDVIQIFTETNRKDDVAPLSEGNGRRTVKLDVALDHILKEKLGFNKVGEIVKP
jgi:hypothetical protein